MPGSTTRGDDPSSEAGRQARGNCPLRKRRSLPYLPRSRPLPAGAPVAGCGHSSVCSADRRACPSACIHARCDSVRQRHSLTLGRDGDAGQDGRLIALSKAADDLGSPGPLSNFPLPGFCRSVRTADPGSASNRRFRRDDGRSRVSGWCLDDPETRRRSRDCHHDRRQHRPCARRGPRTLAVLVLLIVR